MALVSSSETKIPPFVAETLTDEELLLITVYFVVFHHKKGNYFLNSLRLLDVKYVCDLTVNLAYKFPRNLKLLVHSAGCRLLLCYLYRL